MVSVMLLTVSLMTLSVLVIRTSEREVSQAKALVARERALMAAQATLELGAAQIRRQIDASGAAKVVIDQALLGFSQPGDPSTCSSVFEDCIPGGLGDENTPATGQKNRWLTGRSDCAGRPCMRQGAIALLPNTNGVAISWVQVPFRELLEGGDPEARVSLWIRNNAVDAMDSNSGGGWTDDADGRVVFTAMATIRNTTVTIEQEMQLTPADSTAAWSMASPDVGYGGGHNNDNVMAEVCADNFLALEE